MTDAKKRFYLIDGSSYIFRAFFALPRLANSAGLVTHAVYGFANMILRFLKDHRPELLVVVFDAGRETFRNEMYSRYKGNRPDAPRDLVQQLPYIRKILEAFNVAVLELEGFEADDLIGTLVHDFAGEGLQAVVVSGDKDLMQLVSDSVVLLDTMKGQWIDAAAVHAKFGVAPNQVVDVMGLTGDSIDNIPGVKGIGVKTAAALIQRFGTLENLFEHLDELERLPLRGTKRVREALESGKRMALLSRDLATVRRDVPIQVSLGDFCCREVDRPMLRKLCEELEFGNLLKVLDEDSLL